MKSGCTYIFILLLIGACSRNAKKSTVNEQAVPVNDTSAVHRGRLIFNTCVTCHGAGAGGQIALHAPALVNQNGWYLKRQLQNFKAGIRGADPADSLGLQMSGMARTLADTQAMTDVVTYIKTLPPSNPEQTIKGDIQNGHDIYNMICGACHGPGAEGNKELNSPKLTGINDWYMQRQLGNFKSGIRGSHPEDKFGAQMKQMVNTMKDQAAVNDVVAYILSLQQKNP